MSRKMSQSNKEPLPSAIFFELIHISSQHVYNLNNIFLFLFVYILSALFILFLLFVVFFYLNTNCVNNDQWCVLCVRCTRKMINMSVFTVIFVYKMYFYIELWTWINWIFWVTWKMKENLGKSMKMIHVKFINACTLRT